MPRSTQQTMSKGDQLRLIGNALIELGHAPVAVQLKLRHDLPQAGSKSLLLTTIRSTLQMGEYNLLLKVLKDEPSLSENERAIGTYLALRFAFLQMLLHIQQGVNEVTVQKAETFLFSKVYPALGKIEKLDLVPFLAPLSKSKDHRLSQLIDSMDRESLVAGMFTSEVMLVPVTDETFRGMKSLYGQLASIILFLLPEALGLWDSPELQDVELSNGSGLCSLLNDALKYRISNSLFYLPPRLDLRLKDPFLSNLTTKPDRDNFPLQNLMTLTHHEDEVWFVKFSPTGHFLATGSLDDSCIIYDVTDNFRKIAVLSPTQDMDEAAFIPQSFKPELDRKKGVICISWERHERFIVVCCLDTVIRIWNVEYLALGKRITRSMEESKPKLVKCLTLGEGIRTWPCEFLRVDKDKVPRFVVGSPDKVLKVFNIDGVELLDFYSDTEEWQKALDDESTSNNSGDELTTNTHKSNASQFNRVNDLAITPNGKYLVSANNDKQVFFYEIPDLANPKAITNKIGLLSLSGRLTSCNLSASGRYMLLSIAPELLQVWDISPLDCREKPFLKSSFLGLSQALYMVRSCFGYLPKSTGVEELILSGSDHGFIYIWRLETGQLITRVRGHEGLCNSVDWNRFYVPTKNSVDYGAYWCSVGDDRTVQIWGPKTN